MEKINVSTESNGSLGVSNEGKKVNSYKKKIEQKRTEIENAEKESGLKITDRRAEALLNSRPRESQEEKVVRLENELRQIERQEINKKRNKELEVLISNKRAEIELSENSQGIKVVDRRASTVEETVSQEDQILKLEDDLRKLETEKYNINTSPEQKHLDSLKQQIIEIPVASDDHGQEEKVDSEVDNKDEEIPVIEKGWSFGKLLKFFLRR